MSKKTTCLCGAIYRTCDRKRHELTKGHLDFINKNSNTDEVVGIPSDNIYESDSDTDESIHTYNENDDGFLDGLNNDKYISQSAIDAKKKQEELIQKEADKFTKENEKARKTNERYLKQIKQVKVEEYDDGIFSNNPTEILGKDKILLKKKIEQYKIMFKDELKSFKIKKNANVEEMNLAIDEMQNLIETRSTDEFMTEGILASLKMVEGYTVNSNYNLSGLSDLLKLNPEFKSLCKQLYLKYGSFNVISPEYKLMFLVFTSAYIVRNKNKNKGMLNDFLNSPSENFNNI